ncbi:MAG: magnesium/cobalt transporter CorA [Anaerolineales bacterium]|nr:magnesium/cobalt transporter CorA [Anaerolineales bacterium]
MIRSLYYSPDEGIQTDLKVAEFAHILKSKKGFLWVDFEATPPETDEPILREIFGFHPLAVDDALQESHVPKLDDWGSYLYIVLHAVIFDHQNEDHVDTLELDIFLGDNYIVTHHDQRISGIEKVWGSCLRDDRFWRNGPDYLLYRIADEVVASYMPVVEALDDEIDHTEDQVFEKPTEQMLERIFTLKRAVLHLRRVIGPQREVLNKLARDDYKVIESPVKVYFRDVYDHLVRLYDLTESIRDLVSGALDTYLSVINNRMNDIMKTLTIITTFFMPISFITGFFGMNFFQPVATLQSWTGKLAFFITMVFFFSLPLGMLLWIRRKGWI